MVVANKPVSIAVVIPVHNRRQMTLRCLRSLFLADHDGLYVHIIVVDDGSTDGTSDAILERYPSVEIIHGDGNLWYTAATNRGIQAALLRRPDCILTSNDDQVFHYQSLQRLVRCLQQNHGCVIGALLLDWNHPEHVMATDARWNTWYGGWRHSRDLTAWQVPASPWEVEIIVGNCVLFPTEAIEQMGLMNEKALPMYGDAEYTPRMRRAGWKLLIEPRAYVWCQPNTVRPSLRALPLDRLLDSLILDQKNSYNLVTQFRAHWLGTPSRWRGLIAYVIWIFRLGLHGLGLGSWPNWPDNAYFTQKYKGDLLDRQDFTQALASLDSLMRATGESGTA